MKPLFAGENTRRTRPMRWRALWSASVIVGLAAALAAADQPSDDHVGVIDGDDIAINGPMTVESVAGQIKTVLRSGSDLRVKTGHAKISLVEGGQISICGPAHLSLLKSGGSLTIALDNGIIHVRVDRDPAVVIYTPQIQGNTVAVGDAPRDLLVGFESSSVMCIRTYRGALRIQQQLGDESLMIPQGGDVLLTNGQLQTLRNGEGHCKCELQIARTAPVPSIPPSAGNPNSTNSAGTETPADSAQVLSPSAEGSSTAPETAPPKDDRIYQVDMPPLVYDATAKVQPEPDPRIMVIVRRVRVRPTLIFQGRVEAAAPKASLASPGLTPPAAAVVPVVPAPKPAQPQPSFTNRMRSFFRSLWSQSP